MNEQNFEDLLDRHGSDLSLWPENVREKAHELLAQSPAARSMLNAELIVDNFLSDAMVVPNADRLEQKIMARFAAQKRRFAFDQWRAFFWKPAFAATCSLAFGFYLGAANQELPVDLAEDLTYVTFYDHEEWSGDVPDES